MHPEILPELNAQRTQELQERTHRASLMSLARGGRGRWLTLLAGGVLTVVGVMLRGGPGGVIAFPGLLLLLFAALIPASPKADRMRRSELERELALTAFSHPAQRRLASQAMALYDDRFPTI